MMDLSGVKVGDKVTGNYCEEAFEGTIMEGSSQGFLMVRLIQPIRVFDVERDVIGLSGEELVASRVRFGA